MEQMLSHDREVHLVTGHVGSGKSHYFSILRKLPEYQGLDVFVSSTDTVRVEYYYERAGGIVEDNTLGHLTLDRLLTEWDKVYNNELLRVDAERAFLVRGCKKALLDVVMRTRRFHQRPFVAMVRKVQQYLRLIDEELANRRDMLSPDPPSTVHLRVVLFFCDFDTTIRRLMKRWKVDEKTALIPFCQSTASYELPDAYPFLAINTFDGSRRGEAERVREIRDYFSGRTPDPVLMKARLNEARRCITATKKRIKKLGF